MTENQVSYSSLNRFANIMSMKTGNILFPYKIEFNISKYVSIIKYIMRTYLNLIKSLFINHRFRFTWLLG